MLGQRGVDVARLRRIPAAPASGGLQANALEANRANDLRIDDRSGNGARAGAASSAATRARGPAGGRGTEEEVAHRATAACGAGDLGEDREPDRQPEAEHERKRERQRREPGARDQHGPRGRQPAVPIRGCSPHEVLLAAVPRT
jgi:hypothetical protein